jgi:AcrR family transcriptional regulator
MSQTEPADHPAPSGNVVPLAAPRRVRARRGEGERLREEILDAVERILVETGDAEQVSIRAVGQLVGVTAPSIYRHFSDKDVMVHEACQRAYDRFDNYLNESSANETDPLSVIHAQALAYVRFAMDNPGQYRVLFMKPAPHHHDHSTSFDPERSEMKALVHIAHTVGAAIELGVLRPVADPMTLATMLWSGVHGIASLRLAMTDVPWPTVEEQVELLFTLLAFGMCNTSGQNSSHQ